VSSVFDLTGRSALVTDAGSHTGTGFATARLLAEMGASVVITSTTDRIHERVRELRAAGAEAIGVIGDLTDPATAPQLVAAAIERWGRLDVVMQNAGMISITKPQPEAGAIEDMDYALWRASLSRNLATTFLVAKACLPVMSIAGWGLLVLVSSVSGRVMAMRGEPAYGAAKSGMVRLRPGTGHRFGPARHYRQRGRARLD
jgi:3-oxoacyl-[acyl-carrier protein] reductase